MPEIRERDPSDFIKTKGKRKRKGRKDTLAPRVGAAIQEKAREHRDKKEAANEYAVGITEEVATEVVIRAKDMPGDVKRTIEHLQPKTKERVLNRPDTEELEPEEPGHAPDPIEQQQRELAAKKAQEKADAPPPEDLPYSSDSYRSNPMEYQPYSAENRPNQPPEQHYVDTPQYTQHHDPAPTAEAPRHGISPGGSKPDIKEKPKGNTAPKEKPQHEPKTRHRAEQASHKTSRPTKQAQVHGAAQKSTTRKAADKGRKKFQREAQKKMAEQSKKAVKKTAENARKAAVAVGKAIKSVVETIVAAFGGIGLVAILAVVVVIGALLASPLGILFSNESTPNSVPLSSAISQINMELNTRLISLQSGDYEDIVVEDAPPSWTDVVAVFAAYTAGAENGVDVA